MRTIDALLLVAARRSPSATTICAARGAQLGLVHDFGVDREVHHRVEDLHGHARALLDGLRERREVRAAARRRRCG